MSRKRLLLIGWDAADWATIDPLLQAGEMPHLDRLIKRGAHGPLATLEPVLSPMLWATIATGHSADSHGIHGFSKIDKQSGIPRPFGSQDRTARALWNIASNHGLKTHVLNWFCSHPAEPINGTFLSDIVSAGVRTGSRRPIPKNVIHPEHQFAELKKWIANPREIDASVLGLFIPELTEIDQSKSERLSNLASVIAESVTVHNATTALAEQSDWDFIASYYPLIDHIGHGYMQFHPPQQSFISDFDYRMFKDVINSTYRFSDLMLGRLMALAGEDTNIVLISDHGFYNDHRRPQPNQIRRTILDDDHSHFGIFVAAGPAFQPGSQPVGANLLDIAPTLLHTLDLPAGQDMPGRVIAEVLNQSTIKPRIPSWESVEGNFFELDQSTQLSSSESKALLDNFVEMGYIDAEAAKGGEAAQRQEDVNLYNLARVYTHSDSHDKALEILAGLVERNPLRLDMAVTATECYLKLGMYAEGRELVSILSAVFQGAPQVVFFKAFLLQEQKQYKQALEEFDKLTGMRITIPILFLHAGTCALKLKDHERAETFFKKAVEVLPENPSGLIGLAEVSFAQKQYNEALDLAYEALQLEAANIDAHYMIARCLAYKGQLEDAVIGFQHVLSRKPYHFASHRYLARIFRNHLHKADLATQHETVIDNAGFWRLQKKQKIAKMRKRFREIKESNEEAFLEPTDAPSESEIPNTKIKEYAPPQVIISGLPRSGTSLLMQILDKAGVPILSDAKREADIDNPKGYFEYTPIKQLAKKAELLGEMEGKAVKVISSLLVHLKFRDPFKVIFIRRAPEEIARSQSKMIERLSGKKPEADSPRYLNTISQHLRWSLQFIEQHPQINPLIIDHADLIAHPKEVATQIIEFLDLHDSSPDELAACVDPSLHRQKVESGT
ncbi:MAG: alkaline phosphatase family protein [Opitutaceae bacterium]